MTDFPTEVVIGKREFVKLLALSPLSPGGQRVMCCCKQKEAIFVVLNDEAPKPGRIIHRVQMDGEIVAAAFHEEILEIYLKIEKQFRRNGSVEVETEFVIFDFEKKTHRPLSKLDKKLPAEPWKPPAPPKNVHIVQNFSALHIFHTVVARILVLNSVIYFDVQVMTKARRKYQDIETFLVTLGFLFCFIVIPRYMWQRALISEGYYIPTRHEEL